MTTYVSYRAHPHLNFKITTSYGGSSYTFTNDELISGSITRVENGFDTATFLLTDRKGHGGSKNWQTTVDAGSTIKFEVKGSQETNYTEIFDGVVRFVNTRHAENGEFLELKCDGAGYGIDQALVAYDFGSQSAHSADDGFQDILIGKLSAYGIIPHYVNRVLGAGAAGDSGFNYTANSTTVQDITGTVKYLYFPYVPASRAITDLCDYLQAIKGTGEGPHWIVDCAQNFLACTLGADHPDAANNGWYEYYKNISDITLEQGKHFRTENFTKMEREANYILYHGAFQKPVDGDSWTENVAASWGGNNMTVADDGTNYKVGSHSIEGKVSVRNAVEYFYYPSTKDMALDISKLGGKFNIPSLSVWLRRNATLALGASPDWLGIYFVTDLATAVGWEADIDMTRVLIEADKWYNLTIPVGDYWRTAEATSDAFRGLYPWGGGGNWGHIDWVGFSIVDKLVDSVLLVDGLRFNGQVLRAAKDSTIGSSNPYKAKLISDDVAKDDTLVDDTGTIGRLAYAEYLRCNNTPIVGSITVSLLYDLLPGQTIHIHAKKKRDGSFKVDKDMRVTVLTHNFNPDSTTLQLTDDMKNSNPRKSFLDYQNVVKSYSQYQDRQTTSFKTRSIDITQAILETSY